MGSSTETIHGSATGLNPMDLSTPLVTVGGFNADGTAHKLYWKTAGVSEHGIGLTGTNGHELTLKSKGTAFANYMRIDVSNLVLLDWTDLKIRVQSVQANSSKDQEKFDVWGSNVPTSLGTKLISASTTDNAFIPLPLDGGLYDKYYFVTVTPQGKGHSRDNVLLDAISASEETIRTPEPATLVLLGLASLAVRARRRTRPCTID
ncbi:MAG: PEP-CTERM sorting domain-containing protein [Planctomycetota bacterium]|nr:PEP-CTERM sorting domain-containing protein [Planctomycetota bacterium]